MTVVAEATSALGSAVVLWTYRQRGLRVQARVDTFHGPAPMTGLRFLRNGYPHPMAISLPDP
jgi:hypothetical protein